MKNKASFIAFCMIAIIYVATRLIYFTGDFQKQTTWDALGYYFYLPASQIYQAENSRTWLDSLDKTYHLSGGDIYQVQKHTSGNDVGKYLRGVSIMQWPFFQAAHWYARYTGHAPADGFSWPYQRAIAIACLFYGLLGLFLLRSFLLKFFSDQIVAAGLLLLMLATNAIQYIAIEGGQSHGYIFALYAIMLTLTYRWHQSPNTLLSFLMGGIFGLACISRPTEAVMMFIPLLWNVQNKSVWKQKWQMVIQNPRFVISLLLGILLALSPQLLYWKKVTGLWIYDVGSKWDFLNPHWRVLFGPEKGWFVYTPITICMVLGLWLIREKKIRYALITFCLLNIYIIIAWHTWRYGGSYSTRALVQSYPVFAIPLCAFVERVYSSNKKIIIAVLMFYLMGLNLFQIRQYNQTILHYDDMNWAYYRAIYLNPNPSPQTFSLMDDGVSISPRKLKNPISLWQKDSLFVDHDQTIISLNRENLNIESVGYLHLQFELKSSESLWGKYVVLSDSVSKSSFRIRLFRPLIREKDWNRYEAWFFCRHPLRSLNFSIQEPLSSFEIKQAKIDFYTLKD
ncbi:MAG: hypothetical protein ACOYLG_01505 [Chitinophagaceae bacterium]